MELLQDHLVAALLLFCRALHITELWCTMGTAGVMFVVWSFSGVCVDGLGGMLFWTICVQVYIYIIIYICKYSVYILCIVWLVCLYKVQVRVVTMRCTSHIQQSKNPSSFLDFMLLYRFYHFFVPSNPEMTTNFCRFEPQNLRQKDEAFWNNKSLKRLVRRVCRVVVIYYIDKLISVKYKSDTIVELYIETSSESGVVSLWSTIVLLV